jgi:hypothetical protein
MDVNVGRTFLKNECEENFEVIFLNLMLLSSNLFIHLTSLKHYCKPNSLTHSVVLEPEGSSPHSQQPANGPYPEPGESTPHPPNQSP